MAGEVASALRYDDFSPTSQRKQSRCCGHFGVMQVAAPNPRGESTYAGPTLPSDGTDAQKYFWRMMTWDQNNNPSPWTNGDDFFMTPGNRVQDLSYTYDPTATSRTLSMRPSPRPPS
jgi:hypothetical protein